MGTTGPRPASSSAPSVKWSLYAGAYALFCGVVLLLPLGFVASTLVEVLSLPRAYTAVIVPGSGAVFGAVVWWAAVERQDEYTYRRGGAVGLLTALCTVVFWVLLLTVVWGPWAILAGGVVVVFALVVAGPVAFVSGVPLMYARRRLDDGISDS